MIAGDRADTAVSARAQQVLSVMAVQVVAPLAADLAVAGRQGKLMFD